MHALFALLSFLSADTPASSVTIKPGTYELFSYGENGYKLIAKIDALPAHKAKPKKKKKKAKVDTKVVEKGQAFSVSWSFSEIDVTGDKPHWGKTQPVNGAGLPSVITLNKDGSVSFGADRTTVTEEPMEKGKVACLSVGEIPRVCFDNEVGLVGVFGAKLVHEGWFAQSGWRKSL